MSFLKALGNFWINVFNYKGKASRKEFWLGMLQILILWILSIVGGVFIFGDKNGGDNTFVMFIIALIITTFPYISVNVRRLRDIGFSNLGIISVIVLSIFSGTFIIFVLALLSSNALVISNKENLLTKLIRDER